VDDSPKPTFLDLARAFANIGLTSVGGAVGPLRYVLVRQQRWLSEVELAEMFGIAQALPGAVAANVAVMLGDRFAGLLGSFSALFGLIVPSLIVALLLVQFATNLAAVNPRFAAAEFAVTAAVCGIFVSNGIRVISQLWSGAPNLQLTWRCARVAISALGILLVASLHVFVPLAMIVMLAVSFLIEMRLRHLGLEDVAP
jgi:chromate transporter